MPVPVNISLNFSDLKLVDCVNKLVKVSEPKGPFQKDMEDGEVFTYYTFAVQIWKGDSSPEVWTWSQTVFELIKQAIRDAKKPFAWIELTKAPGKFGSYSAERHTEEEVAGYK